MIRTETLENKSFERLDWSFVKVKAEKVTCKLYLSLVIIRFVWFSALSGPIVVGAGAHHSCLWKKSSYSTHINL